MKIALLNPWKNAAENQAAAAISIVANRLGHDVVMVSNTQQLLEHDPDFVLSMSIFVPKLTHFPTYGLIHEPRDIYFQTPLNLRNFVTYDGFFTLADTLRVFTEDLMYAARREEEIGAFYCASNMLLDWDAEPDFNDAHLAYFGINWDRRHEELFRTLSKNRWMEVYGPPRGWEFLSKDTYRGMTPFDGISNLEKYHAAGAGLCLMTDRHLADDVISGRIFEITASGAIAIAPRMPWLERNFGDSLLYVDQDTSHRVLARQIEELMAWVHAHPEEAREKAARSNQVFRERFSLDVMLRDVVKYHEDHVEKLAAPKTAGELVSVIVKGSELEGTERALASIAAQEYADLEVMLCPYGDFDTESIDLPKGLKVTIVRQDGETSPMWRALQSSKGKYVYVMNDATELLPQHFTYMVAALAENPQDAIASTGEIVQKLEPFVTEHGAQEELRQIGFFPLGPSPTEPTIVPLDALLFKRELLDDWLLRDPRLDDAEEQFLALSLLQKASQVFTHRVTVLNHERATAEEQNEAERRRTEDNARIQLRLFGRDFAGGMAAIGFNDLRSLEITQSRRLRRSEGLVEYLLSNYVSGSFDDEEDWAKEALELRPEFVHLGGTSRHLTDQILPIAVTPPVQPWAFGLQIHVPFPDARPYILRVHCRVNSGMAGVGVINSRGDDFIYRVFIPSQKSRVIVNIPVPRPTEAGYFVIQAGDGHEPVDLVLEKMELFAGSSVPLPLDVPEVSAGGVRRSDGRTEYVLTSDAAEAIESEDFWVRVPLSLSQKDVHLSHESEFLDYGALPILIKPPVEPWAFGMQARILYPQARSYVVRVHAQVKGATAAFGVLDTTGGDFLYRVMVPSQDSPVVVNLAVVSPLKAGNLVIQAGAVYQAVEVKVTGIELFEVPLATGPREPGSVERPERAQLQEAQREVRSEATHYRLSDEAAQDFEQEEDWIPVPLGDVIAQNFDEPQAINGQTLPHLVELRAGGADPGWRFEVPFPDERPYVVRLHASIIDGNAELIMRTSKGRTGYRVAVDQQDGQVIVDVPVLEPIDCSEFVIQSPDDAHLRMVIERLELFE